MTDIFFSPHNDDETLFGAFTLIQHQPRVIFCFKSVVQERRYGITAATREQESVCALIALGVPSFRQWNIPDDAPNYEHILDNMELTEVACQPEHVWAPAVEEGGHEQHNLVGKAAIEVFGDRVRPYLTYVRGSMRSRGREVTFQTKWIGDKLRALACYESQYAEGPHNCAPWFLDDTLREYTP